MKGIARQRGIEKMSTDRSTIVRVERRRIGSYQIPYGKDVDDNDVCILSEEEARRVDAGKKLEEVRIRVQEKATPAKRSIEEPKVINITHYDPSDPPGKNGATKPRRYALGKNGGLVDERVPSPKEKSGGEEEDKIIGYGRLYKMPGVALLTSQKKIHGLNYNLSACKSVFMQIAMNVNGRRTDGLSYIGPKGIAEATGYSAKTVERCLSILDGHYKVIRREREGRRVRLYILLPEGEAERIRSRRKKVIGSKRRKNIPSN